MSSGMLSPTQSLTQTTASDACRLVQGAQSGNKDPKFSARPIL